MSRRAVLRSVAAGVVATRFSVGKTSAQTTPTTGMTGPALLIAYPISNTELRLVFSEPIDTGSALRAAGYETETGLRILDVTANPDDPARVTLTTDEMDGAALTVDSLRVNGVRTVRGESLAQDRSPEFIHGIASIEALRRSHTDVYPYPSRLVGKIASASCGKNGGVWEGLHAFRFTFLHEEVGGPYSSIKVATDIEQRVPNVVEEAHRVAPGETLHLLWAGGLLAEIDGETQLVDVGYMEGFILPPLKSPPPYLIAAAEISGEGAMTTTAKSLEAVIVRLENVLVREAAPGPDENGSRAIVLSDDSGGTVAARLLSPVTLPVAAGDRFSAVRAIVHRPRLDAFELLIEWDGALEPAETALPEEEPSAGTASSGTLIISGVFDPAGDRLVEPPTVRRSSAGPIDLPPGGRFAVEVTDLSGATTVVTFDALVADDSYPGGVRHGFFEVTVPVAEEIASIRIIDTTNQKTVAVIEGSGIPP